jgi:hypothetical protein
MQLAIKDPEDKKEIEDLLLKCLKRKKFDTLKDKLASHVGQSIKDSLVGVLIEKIITLALTGGSVA